MRTNFFYISMNRRETVIGWLYLAFQTFCLPVILSILLQLCFPQSGNAELNILYFVINFAVIAFVFRRFFKESFGDLHGRVWPILWKSALALLLSKVITTVMNDFIFFYIPQYFYYTETGPVLINVNDQFIAQMAVEQFSAISVCTVFLVPVTEEVLHRGVVFGSIYAKNPVLAWLVSVPLFALIHVLGYIGQVDATYLLILFVQYIPAAMFLCWLYTSTESIFAPILMHVAFNAIGILSMR